MVEKRFVKYDGNTIVDLKLVQSWILSSGDVDELLNILNNDCYYRELKEKLDTDNIRKNGIILAYTGRECVNCEYGCGGGSDVYCTHEPRGKEAYMHDTDCEYFKERELDLKKLMKNV